MASRVRSLRGSGIGLCFGLLCVGCGPAPGWVEEPEAARAPSDPPPREEAGNCRMSTPLSRLEGRSTRNRGVEGMNTEPCVAPSIATQR